jgi:DNA-directed RNA polymerase subunit F
MKVPDMKKEYDFSKGVRGKFYQSNVKTNLPIYLDEDNLDFMKKIAKKRKTDISKVVNELIRVDKELAKAVS